MNNWNLTEDQLRSWKPRSPSSRVKARLFPGEETAVIESPSPFGGRWTWLAPVMGCCLALLVVSGSRSNQLGFASGAHTTDWLAAVASNQSYAAYIVGGFHSEQNSLQQDPIEWTNGPRTSARTGSIPLAKTNSLIY
jgi:hypothetical protein